jgi:hypothetical protein
MNWTVHAAALSALVEPANMRLAQKTKPRRFVTKIFFAGDFQRHGHRRSTSNAL